MYSVKLRSNNTDEGKNEMNKRKNMPGTPNGPQQIIQDKSHTQKEKKTARSKINPG